MSYRPSIEELQSRIRKRRITTLKELAEVCGDRLDPYEDVLEPMGWNTCDRCDRLGDSEVDFLWLDSFDWEEDNPEDQALLKALGQKEFDHCAICWECVNELTEKGKKL